MSTRHTLVCLPPVSYADWPAATGQAVEPHDYFIESWTFDGRYASHFLTRPQGAQTPSRVQAGRAGHPWCGGGPRYTLDFVAMRDLRGREAAELYDAWTTATAGMPPAQHLSSFLATHPGDPYSARQGFQAQPQLQVLAELSVPRSARHLDAEASALVRLDRGTFIERARQHAVPGDSLLTLDGSFYTSPAFINADDADETETTQYLSLVNGYLDGLPPEHVVVGIDCRDAT